MYTIRLGSRIRIDTPAKLNLFLELRGRRNDGFHELETLMVPINVYDRLIVQPRSDNHLSLHCEWSAGLDPKHYGVLPASQDNLAYQALIALRDRAGIETGADAWLCKRIPSQAGLGGASSDAAAALVAGNHCWNLGWTTTQLAEVAADLGSDVSFFLASSAAVCSGRGEVLEPIQTSSRLSLALIKPPEGLSTAEVYKRARVPDQPISVEPIQSALRDNQLIDVGRLLFNRLQKGAAALSDWIGRLAAAVTACDVVGHQMSGSGTSYFAVCRHERHARHVAARLRATRLGSVLAVSTLGAREA